MDIGKTVGLELGAKTLTILEKIEKHMILSVFVLQFRCEE
jgi:hypothetical protein